MTGSRRSSAVPGTLFAAALILSAGCGDEEGPARWQGTVDTLPGGAVVVGNPAAGVWDSASAWRLEEALRIGTAEGEGPDLFSRISDLELDALGRVYVLERSSRIVKVFDSSGDHLRNLGRKGGGPGEFGDPVGLAFGPEGRLWVSDPGNARFTVYDTAGTHAASYPRQVPGYSLPWPGKFTKAGVLYDVALRPGEDGLQRTLLGFRVTEDELLPADTVPVPPDPIPTEDKQWEFRNENGMMAIGIPRTPSLEWWLDPAGYLWFGRSDRYRVVQRSLGGDTARVVEREWEPVPVTDRDPVVRRRLRMLRERGLKPDVSRIPDVKPVFRALRADEGGNLWVEVSARSENVREHPVDVFDPEGRYLGRIELPFALYRSAFRGDRVCGVDRDELGVERVTCYRIRR